MYDVRHHTSCIIIEVEAGRWNPSQTDDIMGAKMIIDATRLVRRPFEARIEVPRPVVEATDLAGLIPRDQLVRVGMEGSPQIDE